MLKRTPFRPDLPFVKECEEHWHVSTVWLVLQAMFSFRLKCSTKSNVKIPLLVYIVIHRRTSSSSMPYENILLEFNGRFRMVDNALSVSPWVGTGRQTIGYAHLLVFLEQDPAVLAEMIHRHLPVDIGSFGIEHGVLLWKKEQWLQEMQLRSVFVMHPTVFHELLNRNYIGSTVVLLEKKICHCDRFRIFSF